ncbi:MAG: amidohydrolase family protein, partial [Pseudomonadales bacterium]|nr:amidohydrolase family protein [Pseudomonadales bacterium]
TGAARCVADVAIDGDRITEVGKHVGKAKREIDATGRLVTPGFVDIHTHYDGQATWDPLISPSCWHGVTTIVMGNCGVGFAPVKADAHEKLISLMEGVEDIPGTALAEGLKWNWESFPEYLEALDSMKRAVDIGAQFPHSPLRTYVMGDRGETQQDPTDAEVARMVELVTEGIKAGALGFTTSRTLNHRTSKGESIPSYHAGNKEVDAIVAQMGRMNKGVFGLVSDFRHPVEETDWLKRLARESGRRVWFLLTQVDNVPEKYKQMLELCRSAEGPAITAQVAGRPISLLLGWESSLHPFIAHQTYRNLASLPVAERIAKLGTPEVRAQLLAEDVDVSRLPYTARSVVSNFAKLFPMGDPPNYEPGPDESIAGIAARSGKSPYEVIYDTMMSQAGKGLLFYPLFNYSYGDFESIREMILDDHAIVGLGDGGAHCGVICDASIPTFMLSHWTRDRRRGETLPLELIVRKQTLDTARMYDLHDRGVLAPGMKADLNVIDYERLNIRPPRMVHDLPAQGRRLVQEAVGYDATVVSGQVTFEHGESTGALPGRLIRGVN